MEKPKRRKRLGVSRWGGMLKILNMVVWESLHERVTWEQSFEVCKG